MNPEQLRRGRATRSPKDRVLIVGSTTLHQDYARWLLRRVDQHPGLFEEATDGANPEQVLREAARIARKQRAMGSECQQVWVILDGISREHALQLPRKAGTSGVSVVSSVPDLRTWLLLHQADLPEPLTSDTLTQALPATLDQPFAVFKAEMVGRYELARSRALALNGEPVDTDVYRLVEGILDSSKAFHGHEHSPI